MKEGITVSIHLHSAAAIDHSFFLLSPSLESCSNLSSVKMREERSYMYIELIESDSVFSFESRMSKMGIPTHQSTWNSVVDLINSLNCRLT